MPAIRLVNIAPSDPIAYEAEGHLHQPLRGSHNGLEGDAAGPVRGGKPLPRDPTASAPRHELGPTFTFFGVPSSGFVWDPVKLEMVWKDKLTADDQSRLVRHDWAMHSDCAQPAFAIPADPKSKADIALANAIAKRFNAKAPDQAKAESVGAAFQIAGRGDVADDAFRYHDRAVGLNCHVWLPGEEVDPSVPEHQIIQLLAATEREKWEGMLEHIEGPTMLLLNAGRDALSSQHHNTSAPPATFNYVTSSANTTAPVATDTTMTGEVTTTVDSTHGLGPVQATYAHTTSASTDTLTSTRTAKSGDSGSLPYAAGQIAVRNATAAGGTLGTKAVLSSPATLSAVNDALTETLTTTITPS